MTDARIRAAIVAVIRNVDSMSASRVFELVRKRTKADNAAIRAEMWRLVGDGLVVLTNDLRLKLEREVRP